MSVAGERQPYHSTYEQAESSKEASGGETKSVKDDKDIDEKPKAPPAEARPVSEAAEAEQDMKEQRRAEGRGQ